MSDDDGLVPIGDPTTVRLPRGVDAPRVLTVRAFYDPALVSRWLVRVARGDVRLSEVGPAARMAPAVVGAAEALALLGLAGPNLNRIAGVAELPYTDLKMGRVWNAADVEALAAARAAARA